MIRALIVDDENPARRKIVRFLESCDTQISWDEASTGKEAVEMIRNNDYAIVFLDIQMPGMNGFDIIEAIGAEFMPSIIFTTAFEEYALKAFDAMAIDYLLKPFTLDRFKQALQRATDKLDHPSEETERLRRLLEQMVSGLPRQASQPDKLVVRGTDKIHFIDPSEITVIEADGHYIRIHTTTQSYYERKSLKEIETILNSRNFCKIHRSTLLNRTFILEMQPLTHGDYCVILKDGSRYTVSRSYSGNLGL